MASGFEVTVHIGKSTQVSSFCHTLPAARDRRDRAAADVYEVARRITIAQITDLSSEWHYEFRACPLPAETWERP